MPEAADFFSRWSRRKAEVRAGVAVQAEAPAIEQVPEPIQQDKAIERVEPVDAVQPPPPSLEDAEQLTIESDFKPFMQQNVGVDVKNAALKKLFTDPHFNVMDRMDIYIDDYSKADPIPPEMLRRMVGAQLLNLFDDEEKDQDKPEQMKPPGDSADPAPVAQSATPPGVAENESQSSQNNPPHDHNADLQLQPNHATGPDGAESGAVAETGT